MKKRGVFWNGKNFEDIKDFLNKRLDSCSFVDEILFVTTHDGVLKSVKPRHFVLFDKQGVMSIESEKEWMDKYVKTPEEKEWVENFTNVK